jgi:hypothetical protein
MKMAAVGLALALLSVAFPVRAHGASLASVVLARDDPDSPTAESGPTSGGRSEAEADNEKELEKKEFRLAMRAIPKGPPLVYSLIVVAGLTALGMLLIGVVLYFLGRETKDGKSGVPPEVDFSDSTADLEDKSPIDYEALVKALAERAVHIVGPKVAKGQAAKRIIQDKCNRIMDKSSHFIVDELVATLARVFKALDAEEAMLLLDWSGDSSASFPAAPILVAGLLSPMILNVCVWVHVVQVVFIFIPIVVLCMGSIANDWGERCGIPGIFIWCYSMLVVACVLGIANATMAKQIIDGKQVMSAKVDALQQRTIELKQKDATELTAADLREVFVTSAVILEQGLVVEDNMRKSRWNQVLGAGCAVWLFMNLWTFWIVLRWVFVPGIVAFHKSAAEVSGDAYCGATATVFTANFSCLLCMLFIFLNVLSVLKWLSDRHVNNSYFQKLVLSKASDMDKDMLGIPIASLVAKAFFLRGGTDLLSAHLDRAKEEKLDLDKTRREKQAKLNELDSRITKVKAEALKVMEETSNADTRRELTQVKRFSEEFDDQVRLLGAKGSQTAESVQEQLNTRTQEAQEKLDAMMGQLGNVLEHLREGINPDLGSSSQTVKQNAR